MTWQPIETAPKDGTPILVWVDTEFSKTKQAAVYFSDGWVCGHTRGNDGLADKVPVKLFSQPTHWMPLPDPPK